MEEKKIFTLGESYIVTIQNGLIESIKKNGIDLTEFFSDEDLLKIMELCQII